MDREGEASRTTEHITICDTLLAVYQVEYLRTAQKALRRMPADVARRFLDAFDRLAIDLASPGLDVRPLRGRPGWRLRIGGWRAVYRVEEGRLLILVLDVGPRGDIYK
jgi:mRNA interferase RelE/StbE